ncbi:hypothetical protein OTB20_33320 [Streptomyces sp. H27-H1]|uniref:hypothetical protein n=1 Tax=Streptomyces sp. H27-H1 TaxID=2996461 RepID=UPI00226EDA17|nr:hypothetical protein [Streptomyces sp. H27-H1]MCY0930989.1 hypothetical protein [Streptomyces sp. H27-H1]
MTAAVPGAEMFFTGVHAIAVSAPFLATAVLVGGAVWGWKAFQRALRVREALAHRTCVELVPTSTFDPQASEVSRWAHHLGRVVDAAQAPSRGAAVRLRYSVDPDGMMRCFLEGSAQAGAVLSMPGFAEVEVRVTRRSQGIKPVRFSAPLQRKGGAQ